MTKERAKKLESNSRFVFTETLLLGGIAPVLVLVSLAGMPSTAGAQEKAKEAKKDTIKGEVKLYRLPAVEVWGIPYVEQDQRSETVTALTPKEISQLHASTVNDAIRGVPGVQEERSSTLGMGIFTGQILIRGLGGLHDNYGVLTMIDGRPDFTPVFGDRWPAITSVENVARVEVIHGPASVLYGTHAMAGVIEIRTMEPKQGWSGLAQSSAGSFKTTENMVRLGYGSDEVFGLVSGNFRQSNGHLENSASTTRNVFLKLGSKFSEHFKVNVSGGHTSVNAQVPGVIPPGFPVPPGLLDHRFVHTTGDATFIAHFRDSESLLKVWGAGGNYVFPNRENVQTNDREFGVRLRETLTAIKDNMLILGLDYTNLRGDRTARPLARRPALESRTITEIDPYIFTEHAISSAFAVNGGLRVTFNSGFGSEVSPAVGIIYRTEQSTALRARISRGFRSPTIVELSSSATPDANPDLKPERMTQYEVGINQKIGTDLMFDVTAFLQDGSNLIAVGPDPTSPSGQRLRNINTFTHKGIELMATYRFSQYLKANAAITILNVQEHTAVVPLNMFDGGFNYTIDRFEWNVSARFVDQLYSGDSRELRLPDYFVVNTKLSYAFADFLTLFLAIDNMTDKAYQTVPGLPMPRYSMFGGISLEFPSEQRK